VRNGIVRHTVDPPADTLEGQLVRLSDRVAYINHDIDDAIRAGVLREEDIPTSVHSVLGGSKSARINSLVGAAVAANRPASGLISLTPQANEAFERLHSFMFDQVYTNPICKSEESKAIDMIVWLYQYFSESPERLPQDYRYIVEEEGAERAAADYIAGMTDRFAVQCFERCFIPKSWGG